MSIPSEPALRAEALEGLLTEKSLVTADGLDAIIEMYNERVGPMNGARVVARAWTDSDFKRRLLADGTSAIAEYAFEGGQIDDVEVRPPSLHAVFLHLTGRELRE